MRDLCIAYMLVTLTYLYIGFLVFASFPSPPLSKDCIEQVRHCVYLCDSVCVAGKTIQEQDQSGLDLNATSTFPILSTFLISLARSHNTCRLHLITSGVSFAYPATCSAQMTSLTYTHFSLCTPVFTWVSKASA